MIETKDKQETGVIKHAIKTITPEIAADFLSRNVRNRKLMQATVNSYAEQMRRGEWQLTPQGISFNEYNELLDGQHRLNAVIESNINVDMFVFYNVPDIAFKVLDTGNKRQAAQVFAMEGIKYPMEIAAGLKRYLVMKDSNENTLGKIRNSSKISSTLLLENYHNHSSLIDEIAVKAGEFYSHAALYPKSDIVGVYLYLHLAKKHSLSHIDSFFNQLFKGRLINSPAIEKLRSKLIQSALLKSHRLAPRSKFIYLKKVWNAYLAKQDIRFLNDEIQNGTSLDFE